MTDVRTRQADALVEGLQREAGGKLTVFLGAAPGVGKTYTMLTRAQEQLRRGVDLVVGLVETHGRADTQALLEGLPQLPLKDVAYHGHALQEMDLDAVLARRPALVLVDELAHRNAPGSRHERRWQDVMELLDAGIDVWTTVNIQHLESLNDVVMRITGVRVSETVPDGVLDRLHDIVLVDLPPRELIARLQQGKVYVPEQAAQALQAFFSPANLTALRELAMQEAADRVDSSLRETRAARGEGNLPLRRGVLVAIDGGGQSEYLVRVARRIAERRDAPWTVVTVQSRRQDEATRREIDAAFALARRLGGDAELLHGSSIADALLDHAAHNGVSTLVLGRTRERPLARMFNRTLTQQLIQRGAHYEITIISTPQARARSRREGLLPPGRGISYEPVQALIATALACAVAWLAERWVGMADLSMVFIVAVVLVAARTRASVAVMAAILCFLAYNFLFIAPRFTFAIGARQGVITVFLFLAAALVAGRLASRLRMQVIALRAANRHARARQQLGRQRPARPAMARWRKPGGTRWNRPWTCRRGCGSAPTPPPAAAASQATPIWRPPIGPCATVSPAVASPIPWPARSGGSCRCWMARTARSAWPDCICPAPRHACCPSSASWPRRWSTTSPRPRCAPVWWPNWNRRTSVTRPSACARRCSPRYRTICARRWRR